eukprot:TRINITY_DN454_c1_g2_i1.p1 TRINITY_DN454_c1_g2~~TRINITY_DN454_c1_g2_i1.p1  ORF type:complete len:103 (-),score=13.13 TRINITY_DN454_c1_g2_i1:164-472(-)
MRLLTRLLVSRTRTNLYCYEDSDYYSSDEEKTRNIGSLLLYKECLKKIDLLDKEKQNYYYNYARDSFEAYLDEENETRIEELHEHGKMSINYILSKYCVDEE